jgi:hypothetical protein
MILLFNKFEINDDNLKKIYNSLFEDFLARQMYWMFHSEESKIKMKKKILDTKLEQFLFNEYENKKNFKMNYFDKFINDLKKKHIYENIIDIISNDKEYLECVFVGRKSIKKQVDILIKQGFKELFQRCSKEGKDKLKQIISENLNFSDYFDINQFKMKEVDLYDNNQVHEILKGIEKERREEFIKYSFESQRGNYLLLITFFAQKKIEEKGFLEQLEKNYGVYLDVDNFIKEMNQKISEIKTYKQLFEYIGADFIKEDKYKDKDDLDLIIDSYIKAREKNYLVNKPKTNEKSYIKKKNDINDISSNNNIQRQRNIRRNRIRNNNLHRRRNRTRSMSSESEGNDDRERSRDREGSVDSYEVEESEDSRISREENSGNEENENNEESEFVEEEDDNEFVSYNIK